jgi:hypothetical protein
MGRAIFISYRRDDTEGEAGRLFDDLSRTYGDASVFMDVAGINPGIDFRKAIDDNVATCGVLLAMIGPSWVSMTNNSGQRRIDDPNDFVRLEIASALARDIAVIPVLVHDAKMPRPDDLPDNLKNLAYRNSVEITHARWNSDVALLTKALGQYVTSSSYTSTEPVHATVPIQLPPPNAPAHRAASVSSSKTPLIAGVSIAAVLVVVLAFFLMRSSGGKAEPDPTTQPMSPSPSVTSSTGAKSSNPLVGSWSNPAPVEKNGLNKLVVSAVGSQLSIHAWGVCKPTDCDWGTQTASVNGQKATASWSFMRDDAGQERGRVATVAIIPADGKLNVTVDSTYPKHPGNQRQFEFVPTQ